MQINQKRIFPRIEIESLVSYLMVDKDRFILGQGIGKVINLSQGGILLETHELIEAPFVLLSLVEATDSDLSVLGQVAHCSKKDPGNFHVGIRFLGKDDKKRQVIAGIVKSGMRLKHLG